LFRVCPWLIIPIAAQTAHCSADTHNCYNPRILFPTLPLLHIGYMLLSSSCYFRTDGRERCILSAAILSDPRFVCHRSRYQGRSSFLLDSSRLI
jgi:hypothetical protein